MMARLRQAKTVLASVSWGGQPEWQSQVPKGLYAGETVHVAAMFREMPKEGPRLSLAVEGGEVRELRAGEFQLSEEPDLPRLCGSFRLREEERAGKAEEAAQTALRCQLVSRETSLFLVKERLAGEKAQGLPALSQVFQMEPQEFDRLTENSRRSFRRYYMENVNVSGSRLTAGSRSDGSSPLLCRISMADNGSQCTGDTFEKVSQEFNLSRERIASISSSALGKLRHKLRHKTWQERLVDCFRQKAEGLMKAPLDKSIPTRCPDDLFKDLIKAAKRRSWLRDCNMAVKEASQIEGTAEEIAWAALLTLAMDGLEEKAMPPRNSSLMRLLRRMEKLAGNELMERLKIFLAGKGLF
jgi:hypothetical protein